MSPGCGVGVAFSAGNDLARPALEIGGGNRTGNFRPCPHRMDSADDTRLLEMRQKGNILWRLFRPSSAVTESFERCSVILMAGFVMSGAQFFATAD
jgi:hypothetical protein